MGTNRLIWAPITALRAVFTGVGRIVMVADRPQDVPDRVGDAAGLRWRSLDLTGNVRLLSADDLDDGEMAAAEQEAPPEAQASADLNNDAVLRDYADLNNDADGDLYADADGDNLDADLHADANLHADGDLHADADDDAAALPLPSYNSLTLPSIRARLRSLDADQLRVLAAYERTHAERPEVLGMFERRIERLETGR